MFSKRIRSGIVHFVMAEFSEKGHNLFKDSFEQINGSSRTSSSRILAYLTKFTQHYNQNKLECIKNTFSISYSLKINLSRPKKI